MKITRRWLRRMIMETLQEGDAITFPRPSSTQTQTGPDDGEEAEVLAFPHKEPPKYEDHWERSRRERSEELMKPGAPAVIPAAKFASDRQARIDYAVYVVARVSSVAHSLESMYEQDVEEMNLDPKWQPYTPYPMTDLMGKEWEKRVVAGQARRLGYKPYNKAYLNLRKRRREEDIAKSKAGTYQFSHLSPAIIGPNLISYLRRNTGNTAPIHDEIWELKATLDRNDPEEATLYDYVVSADRALDVMSDLEHVKLPPSTGLNETLLRKMIRLMLEGDVINFDPERFQSQEEIPDQEGELVQFAPHFKASEEAKLAAAKEAEADLFQKKRPRGMVFYDVLKEILAHPDVQKMLDVAPRIDPNLYTKLQSVSALIGGKRYEVPGERMKALGVDPWARPTEL